jgi:hypothetical protein
MPGNNGLGSRNDPVRGWGELDDGSIAAMVLKVMRIGPGLR